MHTAWHAAATKVTVTPITWLPVASPVIWPLRELLEKEGAPLALGEPAVTLGIQRLAGTGAWLFWKDNNKSYFANVYIIDSPALCTCELNQRLWQRVCSGPLLSAGGVALGHLK